jgi:hypothetical protein
VRLFLLTVWPSCDARTKELVTHGTGRNEHSCARTCRHPCGGIIFGDIHRPERRLDCFGGWATVSVSNLHGDQGGVAWHLLSTMTSLDGHGAAGSQRLARDDVRAQGGGAV